MIKLNILTDALKKNNAEAKIDNLYKQTIEIFSEKKFLRFL